jgi:hypothetical protein
MIQKAGERGTLIGYLRRLSSVVCLHGLAFLEAKSSP